MHRSVNQIWLSFFLVLIFALNLVFSCKEEPTGVVQDSEKVDSLPQQAWIDPQNCKPCHTQIVDQYLQTGKGRSFYPADSQKIIENWEAAAILDTHQNLWYKPMRWGNKFAVKEFRLDGKDTIHQRMESIDFFIGSGNQTRSYLFQRNGYLFEIPITWYSKKKIWDLSPGYENGQNNRFSREIGAACMQCHVSGFDYIPQSLNRYRSVGHALGCESCHGNVADHLASMGQKDTVHRKFPVSLARQPVQVQFDVCRQCHLEGIKVRKHGAKPGFYTPGKLLSDYDAVFIPVAGSQSEFGFASHAERLQQSRCFQQSAGKMNCTTCHAPHGSPEPSIELFNSRCRHCHTQGHEKICAVNNSATADCKSCHMQVSGTTDIPHVRSTDHFIRRNLNKGTPEASKSLQFRNFAGKQSDILDEVAAKLQYAETQRKPELLSEVVSYVHQLLQEEQLKFYYLSGKEWRNNLDTNGLSQSKNGFILFYWSQLKARSGIPGAISLLQKACETAPYRTEFWFRLATQKLNLGLGSEDDFQRVVNLQADHAQALSNLGFLLLEKRQYTRAEAHLKRALQSEPDYVLAKENLARCLMEQGKFGEAKPLLKQLIQQFPNESRYKIIMESMP